MIPIKIEKYCLSMRKISAFDIYHQSNFELLLKILDKTPTL